MKNLIAVLGLFFLLFSCSETDILDETGKMEVTEFNLPNLPEGYFYEAWLLTDGSYVSVGRINNDSIQNNIARFSKIDATDLSKAQSFAITVETTSGAPSNYVLLVGDFSGNSAQLHTNSTVSNGVLSLANRISGAYTVQNASVPDSEQGNYGTNGIWFFKGSGNNKEATLKLDYKELSYQAWLVKTENNNDWNLNMGIIKSDTLADTWKSFIPAPFATNVPDFPGEDFLQQPGSGTSYPEGFFPVDVKGSKVIITPIFSNYNNPDIPFPIHLLEAVVPTDAVKDANLTRELHINTSYSAKATKL
jgi:hypothetical protein